MPDLIEGESSAYEAYHKPAPRDIVGEIVAAVVVKNGPCVECMMLMEPEDE